MFVDESGADSKTGVRKTGWAPSGVTPVLQTPYNRGEMRLNILPAYTVNGVLVALVYKGLTNSEGFEFWVANTLLPRCNRFPAERSVVVMDNASFHHSERMQALFDAFGVKLVYLPAYSPDLNPIEEFFGELKAFIRRQWFSWVEDPESFSYSFKAFLLWSVDEVGSKSESVRGHFRHSGYSC